MEPKILPRGTIVEIAMPRNLHKKVGKTRRGRIGLTKYDPSRKPGLGRVLYQVSILDENGNIDSSFHAWEVRHTNVLNVLQTA